MQNLRVSLVQTKQYWEDIPANLDYLSQKMEAITATDLILLPEMFQTGFSMNVTLFAEKPENSPSLNWLKQESAKHNAAIYTSMIVEVAGKYYNRGFFVKPDGSFVQYDKRKLFRMGHEDDYFTPGNKPVVVEWKGWKINLQICYDLRFPELSRNFIKADGEANYDICLYVASWPERRAHHWKTLLPARAIENQSFLCGINRVGTDGKELVYSGDSMAYNALGESLVELVSYEEIIHQIEFSKADLDQIRKSLNFLRDVDC